MTAGMEPMRYTLDVVHNDVDVTVLWNDYPIVFRRGHGTQSNLLNSFVVEGENTLRVLAGPVTALGSQYIGVGLFRWLPGSDVRQEIYRLDWTPRFGFVRDGYAEIGTHRLFMRRAFGRWRWEDARPLVVEDEPALTARILELRKTFDAGDLDGFMRLSRLKMTELGVSTGRDPIAVEGVQRAMLGPMFAGKPILFDWDEEDLRFRSGAGGRLVRVLLADGNEPLRLLGPESIIEIPLVYSHLSTGFELVR